MKNKYKKWTAVLLSSAMLFGAAIQSSAAGTGIKEENIYANLNYDGSLEKLYVVNGFELEEETQLLDYGKYKSVKNLTNDTLLSYGKGEVTVPAPSGKFFYQGEMENTQLPWEFSVSYYLDGTETDAEKIAGKTGELELCIAVSENTAAEKHFYEAFQLQVTASLNMEKCSNLYAPGASASNVGTKKQLSWLILPGQEREIRFSADVLDFEMEPIQFLGVPAALEMESEILAIDDLHEKTEALSEKADEFSENALEIQGGAESLKAGMEGFSLSSGILREGLSDYTDGTEMIKDGIGTLYDGSLELLDGSSQLTDGMVKLRDGVNTLHSGFQGEKGLVSGSKQLADGMKTMKEYSGQLADGINELIGMQDQFGTAGTAMLDAEAEVLIQRTLLEIRSMNLEEPELTGTKEEQLTVLSQHLKTLIIQEASVSAAAVSGNSEEVGAISENDLSGTGETESNLNRLLELKSDVDQMLGNYETHRALEETLKGDETQQEIADLQQGVAEFDSGMSQLSDGASELADGIAQVADGVGTLASGTGELVDGSLELTDGVRKFSEGIDSLSEGAGELKNAAQGLLDGAQQLSESSDEFSEGIREVSDAAQSLKEDTEDFKTDANEMDEHLDEELDKAMQEFSVEEYEPVSFVSEKNKNVRMVQFRMKTPEIKLPEKAEPEKIAEQLGFWERLLRLFGFGV